MSFTVGLLLIFLNIILPGLTFLRFYFSGEFSKQFSTKIPLIRLSFYALFPGFVLQVFGLLVYNLLDKGFTFFASLEILLDLMNSKETFKPNTIHFLEFNIHSYLIYSFVICFLAFFFGVYFHKFVRKFKLDIKYKVLRFKNYWYYVFSGDVLHFDKYKDAKINLDSIQNDEERGVMISYVDVLVSQNGESKMYTGYLVDYELDSQENQKLEKIYLFDVQKYNYQVESKFKFQDKFEKKNIPGDLFVIENKHILNLNITYAPSLHKKDKIEDTKLKTRKNIDLIFKGFLSIALLFVLAQTLFDVIDTSYFKDKLRIYLLYLNIISLLSLMHVAFERYYLKIHSTMIFYSLIGSIISIILSFLHYVKLF